MVIYLTISSCSCSNAYGNASVGKKNSKLFKSRFSNFCFQRKKRRNGFELFLPFKKEDQRCNIYLIWSMKSDRSIPHHSFELTADSQVHLPLKASSNPLHVFDASPNLSELSNDERSTLSTLPTASDVL